MQSFLPEEYTIIPSVVVSEYGDADIIIVGPKGVIAIEVKNWSDPIIIKNEKIWKRSNNGTQLNLVTDNPFGQVRGQAKSIRDFLVSHKIDCEYVSSVVVFAGGDVQWVDKKSTLIFHVRNLHKLLEYIDSKATYNKEDAKRIVDVLKEKSFI